MQDLQVFHRVVRELMDRLGFADDGPKPGQDVITLSAQGHFDVHFGALDEHDWFMLAELHAHTAGNDLMLCTTALRYNRISTRRWQPTISLDDSGRLGCWLRLPLHGLSVATMAEAFDALVDTVDQLLSDDHPSLAT